MLRRLILTVVLLAASQQPVWVDAAIAPRAPSTFRWVKVTVNEGDDIKFACDGWEVTEDSVALFSADSLTSPGGLQGRGLDAIWLSNDVFVRVTAADQQVEPVMLEGTGRVTSGDGFKMTRVTSDGSVYRAAWAGWGIDIACRVRVNGNVVPSTAVAKSRARFALPSDMSTGVGVNSEASAGAALTYGWEAKGYLFAWLFGEVMTIQGPDDGLPQLSKEVVEGQPGPWQFTMVGDAKRGSFPAVYLMDLPS